MELQYKKAFIQRFRALEVHRLAVGLLGLVLFGYGLSVVYTSFTSPDRHTSYKTTVSYEPVVREVRADKRASTGLDWIPIVLTIPHKVSINDFVSVTLSTPLLSNLELAPQGTGLDASLVVMGAEVDRFLETNPRVFEGITLEPETSYSITVEPVGTDRYNYRLDENQSKSQVLASGINPEWTWTMYGLYNGLNPHRSKFDITVHDEQGIRVGGAAVTLTYANPVMRPDLVYSLLAAGLVLLVAGFGHLLDPLAKKVLSPYLSNPDAPAASLQHRFGMTALRWSLVQKQKNAASRNHRSPFAPFTPFTRAFIDMYNDPSQTADMILAALWLNRAAYIPGTQAYQRRLEYQIIMRSRELIQQFRDLTCLPGPVKSELNAVMRRYAHQLARIDTYKETLKVYFLFIAYVLLILNYSRMMLIFDLIPSSYFDMLFEINILLAMIGFILFSLLGALVFLPIFIPILLLDQIFEFWRQRRHPDAVIVQILIALLGAMEVSEARWSRMVTKKSVLSQLEIVARSIEYYLPRRLRSKDVSTDLWFQQRASGMAASIRDLKLWVLTPKADTQRQLITRLAFSLEKILRADWDALPATQPPSPLRSNLLISRLSRAISTLVIAVLPWVMIEISFNYGILDRKAELANNLPAGAVLFAIITVVLAFDPRFSDKIDLLKNILGLLNPISKPGK